jgi:hypothetical protein
LKVFKWKAPCRKFLRILLEVLKSLFNIGNQSLTKVTLFEEKFTLLRDKYD